MSIIDEKSAPKADEAAQARRISLSNAPEVVMNEAQSEGPIPVEAELGAEDDVPPAYSEFHDQFSLHQTGFDAGAAVTDDGRVNININQTSRHLADFIAPALRNQLRESTEPASTLPPAYIPPSLGGQPGQTPPPRLNVVIQIVGSRGDVQPFVALGQVLKNTYGHRVRVATHTTFQKFVEENGLEFFNIGGDPAELMAFMVKNPGLMPGMDALKSGEITKRRKGIEEIVLGCWRSCIETGNGLGPAPRFDRRSKVDAERDELPAPLPEETGHKPFIADAIIANPPSFAHIHVAEKLGVPLHLMFTMPWSPTRAFPQPLANIQSSNTDPVTTNYVSYTLVEMMTWQGLGDVINRFRTKILDLEPLSILWAPAVLTRLRIPYTYCWSPALIPKPNDWGQHIDVAGFYFLNLASSYTPDPELAAFLAAGPPPIYIGFGSIVVDDPNGLTRTIFDAVAETGVRALVSKGWGGLGADSVGIPDGVFMLGNVPHDWLFQHVSAVCHHGGAGTTAAGINAGKPTIVVPFFGDQPFWGAMVARAGAGPDPIPYKSLTAAGLAEAIRVATKPETQARARELGEKIREENGTDVGAQSFHRHLNVDRLRCALAPSRVAVWRLRRTQIFLSALAAATLVNAGYLRYSDLKLFRANEYSTEDHPTDPISACTSALIGDIGTIAMSAADFPRELFKAATPKSRSSDKLGDDSTTMSSSEANNSTPSLKPEGPADSTTTLVKSESLNVHHNPLGAGSENNISTTSIPLTPTGTGHSRSPSGTASILRRNRTDSSHRSGAASPNLLSNENFESAIGAGKSINNIVATGMKSPMNFCLGLARGFRNAPTLYNDDTVRPAEKVTDFASGLKIAGKEFGFGMFDGITGLVTQPIRGAEKEGAMGALKGFSKGIGGLVFKPAAAIWSIPAYTMQGVHAEIRTLFAQSAQKYIIASRISQSQDDFANSSPEEREDIEVRWISQKENMKDFYLWKQKEKGKARDESPASSNHGSVITEQIVGNEPPKTGWFNTRHLSYEERKKLQEQKKAWKKKRAEAAATGGTFIEEHPATNSTRDDHNFEEAILTAVRETSRGDESEDARVEQAIRSSVRLLRSRSTTLSSLASTISQATQDSGYISMVDHKHPLPNHDIKQPVAGPALPPRMPEDLTNITDEEYQALIEQAVQLSIAEQQGSGVQRHDVDSSEDEDYKRALERSQTERSAGGEDDQDYKEAIQASGVEGRRPDDEEELRKAIEASQAEQTQGVTDDEELRRAIEESEKAHKEQLARASSLRTEEDIVLEYVKKQSLAEEEFRKTRGKQADTADEDEELRRALEESMRTESGARRGGGGGPS
ncbi:glycosyltransferase family 1 protein [Annulohypoxylon truncatum]|uniref:glycosyltransferase family 1 protein n=1 Tax=Annulohypoxylon truncatum TaxID=327061 RepID=UPI002007C130|nr:glycosyltransferase family 1 protein [Annulohypoxylon truncatum]KAI1209600.1 glycosyltransferase family 1 protein [Annulohypoxylon truncatum]